MVTHGGAPPERGLVCASELQSSPWLAGELEVTEAELTGMFSSSVEQRFGVGGKRAVASFEVLRNGDAGRSGDELVT